MCNVLFALQEIFVPTLESSVPSATISQMMSSSHEVTTSGRETVAVWLASTEKAMDPHQIWNQHLYTPIPHLNGHWNQ